MSDYPDWVLAHKVKGTYVNKVGDKYYLYAAHSERIPGTKKVRRVCDGYLGRITKDNGLIPPKDKLPKAVRSYEFGLSSLILSVCSNIHKGLRRSFVINGDFIMAASILSFLYGFYSQELFLHSWLSLHFSQVRFPDTPTPQQTGGIERGTRMIADTLARKFGEDLAQVRASFSLVTLFSIDGQLRCCELPDSVSTFINQYELDWRTDLCQK